MKTFLTAVFILAASPPAWANAIYDLENGQVVILSVGGDVQARVSNHGLWSPAGEGMLLSAGAEVQTGAGSSCRLGMGYHARNAVQISETSHIALQSIEPSNITIVSGETMAWVRHLSGDSDFRVTTPTAVAAARGTGWAQSAKGINCFEDTVHVTSVSKQEVDLPQDKSLVTRADGALGTMRGNTQKNSADWQSFVSKVMSDANAEDFIFVKNEGSESLIKMYTRVDQKEYKLTEIDDLQYQIRLRRPYEPVGTEVVNVDSGLIKSIEILYADLTGVGSRHIAEIRVLSKVPVRIQKENTFYGLRIHLKDRFGMLKEVEKSEMPPPLPEPANESSVSASSTPAGGAIPKAITSWNQVNTSGFGSALNADIPAMAEYRGFLYAGTTNTGGAKLFRSSNGESYGNVDLTGVSGFSGHVSIRSMAAYPLPESASTRLYLGCAQTTTSATEGSVFVTSDGTSFTELDGAGKWAVANDGGNDSPAVSALTVFNDKLYVGISFARFNAELWRRSTTNDAAAWEQVLTKAQMNTLTGGLRNGVVHQFKIFSNKLYVAIESTAGGGAGPVLLASSTGDSGSWELVTPLQ